jgi:hypothetical protein
MSHATIQDVWFALDLDRFRVAESAEATPKRARGRSRITEGAVQVGPRIRAQAVAKPRVVVEMKSRRAAQAKAISP